MNLIRNPNSWSCLPTSVAMVVRESLTKILELIGHDGSPKEIGFHPQECIEALFQLGYSCTPIEAGPQQMPHPNGPVRQIWFPQYNDGLDGNPKNWNWQRFVEHLRICDGFITGISCWNGKEGGHAVAWDHVTRRVYDPIRFGEIYPIHTHKIHGFDPMCFWKVAK